MDMQWIWLGVIVSLLLIEFVSMNFTAIWFVVSALVSMILLKLDKDYIVQVLTFLLLGMVLITVLRPKIISKLSNFRDKIIAKVTKKHPFLIHLIPHELRKSEKVK